MISRNTLTWILSLVALTGSAFITGWNWPHEKVPIEIQERELLEEISASLIDGELSLTTPKKSIVMLGDHVYEPNETLSVALSEAFPLHWWSDDWAITFKLENADSLGEPLANTAEEILPSNQGQFVASKSGSKYHPVENCSFADRIKPENKIFFQSEESARQAGYEPSSCFNN